MNQIRIAALAASWLGLVIANCARAVTYKATLLHPAGFDSSLARGVSGASQVGHAVTDVGSEHALLWNGTAASVVDLNPAGFYSSRANSVSGANQVGWGAVADRRAPSCPHVERIGRERGGPESGWV